MSHLTSSPSQHSRPSASRIHPLQRPQHPISPPDTEVDTQVPLVHPTPSGSTPGDHSAAQYFPANNMESPAERFRRVSSLAYNNKGNRSIPKPTRWLVVVIPPVTLSADPSLLPALSSAPPARFSSGTLLPLYPTLYGQLCAIAKEFGLPMTNGISMYLHFDDGPHAMSPRVTDESWQLLWGSYFIPDDHAPNASHSSHRLPIAGRVEFDIDTRKASWFNNWAAHSRRASIDTSVVAMSMMHQRGASRTSAQETSPDHEYVFPAAEDNQSLRLLRLERTTFQPKKLSLLERRDTSRLSSVRRTVIDDEPEMNPTRLAVATGPAPRKLSPIPQEKTPGVPHKDLDTLVMRWRETSAKTPVTDAMRAVNDPTSIPDEISELDLNDFHWSISSAGPPSWPANSPTCSEGVLSIDLMRRLEGSVIMTPSVATSFGPFDEDWIVSPASNASRYPSPDIASRMMEDVPFTPSEATSFGPVYDDDGAYMYDEDVYFLSPDLGQRTVEDMPATPSAASTWGPIYDDDLASPMSNVSRYPSPDIAKRMLEDVPVTPSTATSWGAPEYWPASPMVTEHITRPAAWAMEIALSEPTTQQFTWPYYSAWSAAPSSHVWPYLRTEASVSRAAPAPPVGSPEFHYRFVFPYLNKAAAPPPPVGSPAFHSRFVTPHLLSSKALPVTLPLSYPSFSLYPAAYPHFDIYPAISISTPPSSKLPYRFVFPYLKKHATAPVPPVGSFEFHSRFVFPYYKSAAIAKVPSVGTPEFHYRFVSPYLKKHTAVEAAPIPPVGSSEFHCRFVLPYCKAIETPPVGSPAFHSRFVFPYYKTAAIAEVPSVGTPEFHYRFVFPYLKKHTAVEAAPIPPVGSSEFHCRFVLPYCKAIETPSVGSPAFHYRFVVPYLKQAPTPVSVTLKPSYPSFSLYPAVYPVFEIYPAVPVKPEPFPDVALASTSRRTASPISHGRYPYLEIYPPCYPHFSLYPPAAAAPSLRAAHKTTIVSGPRYPFLEIYPLVYPHLSLYPTALLSPPTEQPVVACKVQQRARRGSVSRKEPSKKSSRRISPMSAVPPVPPLPKTLRQVPHRLSASLAPMPLLPTTTATLSTISVRIVRAYPHLDIYPAAYPNFCLYPPTTIDSAKSPVTVALKPRYPAISLYPAVYPHFDIYPSIGTTPTCPTVTKAPVVTLESAYPNLVIYKPVYPFVIPYPDVIVCEPQTTRKRIVIVLESSYPNLVIYQPAYPYVTPYPDVAKRNSGSRMEAAKGVVVALESQYPTIVVYKPAYPFVVPYPPIIETPRTRKPQRAQIIGKYPFFEIYPACYPDLSLYPAPAGGARPKTRKTHLELHLAIFGQNSRQRRKTHEELHRLVLGNDTSPIKRPLPPIPHRLSVSPIKPPPPVPRRLSLIAKPAPPPVPPRGLSMVPEMGLGRSASLGATSPRSMNYSSTQMQRQSLAACPLAEGLTLPRKKFPYA